MRQIGPEVESPSNETPTLGQNLDSRGLQLQLHTPAWRSSPWSWPWPWSWVPVNITGLPWSLSNLPTRFSKMGGHPACTVLSVSLNLSVDHVVGAEWGLWPAHVWISSSEWPQQVPPHRAREQLTAAWPHPHRPTWTCCRATEADHLRETV